MTSQEFCYWLQGFFEISAATEVTTAQAKVIQDHLQLVFTKVTPSRAAEVQTLNPYAQQAGLGSFGGGLGHQSPIC